MTTEERARIANIREAARKSGDYLRVAVCDRAMWGLIPVQIWRVLSDGDRAVVGKLRQEEAIVQLLAGGIEAL